MIETTIRFGLTDGIQTNVSHGIQAALIRKILQQSAVPAGGTATENISPDNSLSILQQSKGEETMEPTLQPEEKLTGLQATVNANTVTTSYYDESQVSTSSSPPTSSPSSKYESKFEQEDSITLPSLDPVQTHISGTSSFSSSSNTYRHSPSLHYPFANHVPAELVPPHTETPPLDTQEFDTTELSSSTILPMHHLPSGKWSRSTPELTAHRVIVVHLYNDPDSSSLKEVQTWNVRPLSKNVFRRELWNAGYRWFSDSSGSVAFVAKYRTFSWETLEPFTVQEGGKTKPFVLYRRPTGRLDILLGTGLGFLMHLASMILFMWQPWRTDFVGSLHAFLSNFLPMLAQWWMRIELKRSGERSIDPYLNSIYRLNPQNLLY
ncbi:hypothetical protein H2248_001532 [Termitomyces sp. 'cryptogamus']|nr:hypothetical protein H2248_001532 [Termitomyces sp. 'cryptogamus']